jgi:hypothetical protein
MVNGNCELHITIHHSSSQYLPVFLFFAAVSPVRLVRPLAEDAATFHQSQFFSAVSPVRGRCSLLLRRVTR